MIYIQCWAKYSILDTVSRYGILDTLLHYFVQFLQGGLREDTVRMYRDAASLPNNV